MFGIFNAMFGGGGEDVPVDGANTDEDYADGQEIASIARQSGHDVESVRLTQWGGVARTSSGGIVEVEEDEYS